MDDVTISDFQKAVWSLKEKSILRDGPVCNLVMLMLDTITEFDAIIHTGRPPQKRITYQDYLQTDHWRDVSLAAKERSGHRCQLCGCKDKVLNTHHNSYANVGKEEPVDLIVLCDDCHAKYHNKGAA